MANSDIHGQKLKDILLRNAGPGVGGVVGAGLVGFKITLPRVDK